MRLKEIKYLFLLLTVVACASIGRPDGGPYDEDPPVLVKASPALYATNVKSGKVELQFNENVKLSGAFEKVIVSPPQVQMPEIKAAGKYVSVELFDTLQPNTTYSIDFGDAIVDNNEGNPYENFAYVFSTGDAVDTLAVSGTVLEAKDLEPIKGMVVGVHSILDDTVFTSKPFERISRTDARGRFTIKGLAPGKYRVYALADANQNNIFDQKSEKIAIMDTYVSPFATQAMRADTIWRDSLTIDTIKQVQYTRFQPDDIVLRAYLEEMNMQYIVKHLRPEHHKAVIYFASANKELPKVQGIGFNLEGEYLLEASEKMDTLTYWFKDSALYCADTLSIALTYKVPDSLGIYSDQCDTLNLVTKKKWAKLVETEQNRFEEEKKRFLKSESRKEGYDENNPPQYVPKTKLLSTRFTGGNAMDVNGDCAFSFDEPLLSVDTAAIQLLSLVDTTWMPMEYVFRQSNRNIKEYKMYAEWRPGKKYRVVVDSAAFKGLYGGVSEKIVRDMAFRTLDEYAVLYVNIAGAGDNAIVQLITDKERVVMQEKAKQGRCSFYFIKPGTYYMRMLIDSNGNGKWDTGDFGKGIQPEKVYYYHHKLDLRALFEYSQDDWDINMPLDKQKPLEIIKQKPPKERQKRNRNATRKFK